ncbi:hypothetical protein PENSPDRAFT_320492 [Peniophora sp. CONT]|nr:hypothetical protein PENSPDRAFT_320492 [Peniophora sp. CONT]
MSAPAAKRPRGAHWHRCLSGWRALASRLPSSQRYSDDLEYQTAPSVTTMQTLVNNVAAHSCMAATTHIVPAPGHMRLIIAKFPPPRRRSQDNAAMPNRLPIAPHTVAATTVRDIGIWVARVNAAVTMPLDTVTEYVICISV